MTFALGECSDYLRQVEEKVFDVLSLCSNFKLQVQELMVIFCRKFEVYHMEKARVEVATGHIRIQQCF